MFIHRKTTSKLAWQSIVLGIVLSAACHLSVRDMPIGSWPKIVATILLIMTPVAVAAVIGYEVGRDLGYLEGRRITDLLEGVREMESIEQALKRVREAPVEEMVAEGADEVQAETITAESPPVEINRGIYGRLGELAQATQARFWNTSRGFDPQDRNTYTSQAVIIEWIRAQSTTSWPISEADAKAVEKIACPIKR